MTGAGGGTDLATGLARALGTAVSDLSQSTAGARRTNVIFRAGGRRLVATIVPPGLQGELGEATVGVEAAVRDLARRHGVAVPSVEFVSDDPGYVGGPLMVSEFVEGETVPRRILRLVDATPGLGARLGRQLGESLARLHAIDPAVAPAGLRRPAGDPAPAMLAELAESVAALPVRRPVMEYGLDWLAAHLPEPPGRTAIVHADVRNGNVIVGPDGLRAILDWELALAGGDPMEDLAWAAVRMWRFGNDPIEIGGFADRAALVEGYRAAGGEYDAARFEWWKAARTLWWAVGLASQAVSYLSGAVPSIVMAASGRRVSEAEWDLLMLTRPGSERAWRR